MYAYIKGEVARIREDSVIVDNHGIGYSILVPSTVRDSGIRVGDEIKLYTHFAVREDAMLLYGFLSEDDLELFRMLLGVSGVGASTARVMLSSLSVDELSNAIATQDAKRVQRVKGIGAKTAQRIVLELHDKVSGVSAGSAFAPAMSLNKEEALSALVMLGFPKAAADKVLQSLDASHSVEELIKEALQRL